MGVAYIAISYMCNQKCSFCPCSQEEKKYQEAKLEELKANVIDMMERSLIDGIVVSGGEPTLYSHFIEFIQFLCKRNLKITLLSTSEKFSDKEFVKSFANSININQIEVISTIHSHLQEQHERINGTKNSFERTITGLNNLSLEGIHTTVKHCITRENYKDLKMFYEFVDERFPLSTDIQMCSIDYCGIMPEEYEKHKIVFPELDQYFEKLFDYHIEKGNRERTRHMYCINMPLCSADPYYWRFFAQKPDGYSEYVSAMEKGNVRISDIVEKEVDTFGKVCKECKAESICPGTYRSAFELFGDKIVKKYT